MECSSCDNSMDKLQESSFGGFASLTNSNPINIPLFGFPSTNTATTFMSTGSSSSNATTNIAPSGFTSVSAFGSPSNTKATFAPLQSSSIGFGASHSQPTIFAPSSNSSFGFGRATQASTESMTLSSLFPSSTTPTTTTFPSFGCGFITSNVNANTIAACAPTWNSSGFKFSTTTATPCHHGFDFSRTPLHCFANIPSPSIAKPALSSLFPFPSTTRSMPLDVGEKNIPPCFKQPTSTPTFHVCKICGNKSFWGQHWGTKISAYNPTCDDSEPLKSMLISISAMPVYKDKSPDELRWEDYQSQGKTQGSVAPGSESDTLGQTRLVALPVLMLTVMPQL